MIALREWFGWKRVRFTVLNCAVNAHGWKWRTIAGQPRLVSPAGSVFEFRLVRGEGAYVRELKG